MTTFNLPDLGEGLTEATLLSWLVAEGDAVEVDQPIAEVETAKSAIEVPSPYAGTVQTLHGEVGEALEVGRPLITVGEQSSSAEESSAGALSYREEERAGTSVPDGAGAEEGSGNVLIGYGTSDSNNGRRRRRRPETPQRQTSSATAHRAPRVSSPLVRRLAREHGVALRSLTGSGPEGLIVRADVLAAAGQSAPAETAPQAKPTAAAPAPQSPAAAAAGDTDPHTGLPVRERVPVTGMRKAIATKLSRSRKEIPEATVWQDVDVTALLQMREQLKAPGQQTPSVLAFLSRFVVAGLQKYPELNSRIESTTDGEQILQLEGINLGFAAQTEAGLVVPVLRGAEQLSARTLHAEIRRLAEAARAGSLGGKELSGGTFTVNNYGVFGSDGATPIINHPEAAIMGIGRMMDRPWAVEGELAVRKVTTVTLAFDHRVCDGGAAGGFLNFVATCLENPAAALADL